MRHLEICSFLFLSLGLMGSACRKDARHSPETMAAPTVYGTWELTAVHHGADALEVDVDWHEPVYLRLTENGGAQWLRPETASLSYCEAEKLPLETYRDADLDQDHLFLANGVLPAHTVFPEGEAIAPVDLEWERAAIDVNGEPCRNPPTPVPTVPTMELPATPAPIGIDPVPGPIDDADARVYSLTPIAYRVVQGRPMLFETFETARDLKAISTVETQRSEYLKVQNEDKRNIILSVDFLVPGERFDALRIQTQMHSDSSGQFRPGRNLFLGTRDSAEPLKWLDHRSGGAFGLGNKDEYFTTILRKNLERYRLVENKQTLLRVTIELDYSALKDCRVLGFVPCWERPALFVDLVGVDLLKFPGDQDQL